ncbi:MAG TPA: FAD/NAD(P)-binding oxidoreductase, partial [Firmicutes bacterium]|nr:FAD/NAD(P)-binding oxidoreductase [Bacillota bacterium]
MYDVAIIGGGIIGCSIARELSGYSLKVCVLEKASDVGCGTSKANSAIVHAGYDASPGSLKAKLNLEGNSLYTTVCKELSIPFKRVGSIVVAFDEKEVADLNVLYEKGMKNKTPEMRIIAGEELRALEPYLAEQAVAALYAKTAGIICPFTLTIALAENACTNGVNFFFDTEVQAVYAMRPGEPRFVLKTNRALFETKYIVNAAGVHADAISQMAGGDSFFLTPRKGEYCILDKDQRNLVTTVIFQVPTKMGKGILVAPTIDGNLLIGPNAHNIEDKQDTRITAEGL